MICDYFDAKRTHGFSVELVCAILRAQGCEVAPRSYRAWKIALPLSTHDYGRVCEAAIRVTKDTPEGVNGRPKMTTLLQRTGRAVGIGTVDRLMRDESLSSDLRCKVHKTTTHAKGGKHAGDPLGQDVTAPCPNRFWATDYT